MTFNPDQTKKENKIETKKVSSFETARGSVYTYLPDGKIQRFKKTTGETFIQNVVVFIPDWEWFKKNASETFINKMESGGEFEQEMLRYCQDNSEKLKVWIVDEKGNKLDTAEMLNNSTKVFLYFGDYEKMDFIIPVKKIPEINYLPFDTVKYKDKEEEWKRQSHIGNKVVKINYEN